MRREMPPRSESERLSFSEGGPVKVTPVVRVAGGLLP
jgi:hypothetical protein